MDVHVQSGLTPNKFLYESLTKKTANHSKNLLHLKCINMPYYLGYIIFENSK